MKISAVTAAYETIKKQITSQEILPGEHLVEAKLARDLAVSRTPIRLALKMLEREGLVEIVPNKYSVARSTKQDELIKAHEFTEALDGIIAYLVAERVASQEISQTDLNAFTDTIDRMKQALLNNDMKAWADTDHFFHLSLTHLCNNHLLIKAYEQNIKIINEVLWFVVAHNIDKNNSNEMHRDLIDAIRQGDSVKARSIAQDHRRRIIHFLKGNQSL